MVLIQPIRYFYIVKNLWKPHRKPVNLPYFRLPAPIGQKFNRISIDFLQYRNGSKKFYDLLRPIPTYTEGPQIFKKNCNRPNTYVSLEYHFLHDVGKSLKKHILVKFISFWFFFSIPILWENTKLNIIVCVVNFNYTIWIEALQTIRGIFPKLS